MKSIMHVPLAHGTLPHTLHSLCRSLALALSLTSLSLCDTDMSVRVGVAHAVTCMRDLEVSGYMHV